MVIAFASDHKERTTVHWTGCSRRNGIRSRFNRSNRLAKTLKFDLVTSDKPCNASRKGDVVRLDGLVPQRQQDASGVGQTRRLMSRIRVNLKESPKWQ
jgi:hypothetical protein